MMGSSRHRERRSSITAIADIAASIFKIRIDEQEQEQYREEQTKIQQNEPPAQPVFQKQARRNSIMAFFAPNNNPEPDVNGGNPQEESTANPQAPDGQQQPPAPAAVPAPFKKQARRNSLLTFFIPESKPPEEISQQQQQQQQPPAAPAAPAAAPPVVFQKQARRNSIMTFFVPEVSTPQLEEEALEVQQPQEKVPSQRDLLDGIVRKPKPPKLKHAAKSVMAALRHAKAMEALERQQPRGTASRTRIVDYDQFLESLVSTTCKTTTTTTTSILKDPKQQRLLTTKEQQQPRKTLSFAMDENTNQVWSVIYEFERVDVDTKDLIWWSTQEFDERYDQDQVITSFIHSQYSPLLQMALESTKKSRKSVGPLNADMVDMDLGEAALCSVARGLESEVIPRLRDLIVATHSKSVLLVGTDDEMMAQVSLKYSRPSKLMALKLAQLDQYQVQL